MPNAFELKEDGDSDASSSKQELEATKFESGKMLMSNYLCFFFSYLYFNICIHLGSILVCSLCFRYQVSIYQTCQSHVG